VNDVDPMLNDQSSEFSECKIIRTPAGEASESDYLDASALKINPALTAPLQITRQGLKSRAVQVKAQL
jgi:hypothetical protein